MNGSATPVSAAAAGAVARLASSYGLATADRIRECLAGPCAGAVVELPPAAIVEFPHAWFELPAAIEGGALQLRID